MSIQVGWVGTAHIHTPGFTNNVLERGVGCAGVWDHDAARAAKNAEKLGGPVVSVEDLVANSAIDGFVICSETLHHLDLVTKLVPAGKPIFIEKPMGFDGAQSEAIRDLLNANGIVFHTGYFSRGIPPVQTLRRLVAEGAFGTITRVRASNCHSGALGGWFDGEWRWMADRSQAGVGAFGDLGTHVLDLFLWIFGGVTSVTGAMSNGTARYPGCEEYGEAILKFSNGIIGTMAAGWNDVADPFRLIVAGTKGHALMSGGDLEVAGADGKFAKVELDPSVPSGFGAFLDFLEGKSVDLVTASEATNRDVVMSAIYTGAESGSWVGIDSQYH